MAVSAYDEKVSTFRPSFQFSTCQRLSRYVSYYLPEKVSDNSTKDVPSLIIIAGWMAASPKHISKYTAGYAALYPQTRIIVVTTTPWNMIPLDAISGGSRRVQPVLDICYDLKKDEKVLIHLMSNGGMRTCGYIVNKFKENTGRLLPIGAVVIDSAPGKATWNSSVRAFSFSSFRNPVMIFLRYCLIYFLFSIYCSIFFILNTPDTVAIDRMDLNDPEIFDRKATRLYIYSESDQIVDWKDVEEHAIESKDAGYQVSCEKFSTSGHAGHLMVDGTRYWDAIKRLWERSVTSS
ncbi:Transmembrane protein 53 [Golovinomyces cichoracearum]|uniref:Transmembrane protein 53 n=1 Tax=Golovinomyces cichoracearum TaxID=62708 RepID=A0A420J0T5_9PEZI|nr:Transmembrane protein 53 [Golovinomyces cichoracearum]